MKIDSYSTCCMVSPQLLLALVTGLCLIASTSAQPREFTNLQVLADDIDTREMIDVMKKISTDLGVDCRTCHRTDIRDYASDEIPAKLRAREMILMTEQLNDESSGPNMDNAAKIECRTCHDGKLTPTP